MRCRIHESKSLDRRLSGDGSGFDGVSGHRHGLRSDAGNSGLRRGLGSADEHDHLCGLRTVSGCLSAGHWGFSEPGGVFDADDQFPPSGVRPFHAGKVPGNGCPKVLHDLLPDRRDLCPAQLRPGPSRGGGA